MKLRNMEGYYVGRLPLRSVNIQRKIRQFAKIRHFQLQERQYTWFQVKICLFLSYMQIFNAVDYDNVNLFDILINDTNVHTVQIRFQLIFVNHTAIRENVFS